MVAEYLFVFAQTHEDFRIPELLSVSELHGIHITFPEEMDVSRPFMVLGLDGPDDAKTLARRCVLIKCGHRLLCVCFMLTLGVITGRYTSSMQEARLTKKRTSRHAREPRYGPITFPIHRSSSM